MPLIGADVYLQQVSSTFNVVAFLGHWGSYKTYTAVLTAYHLLKTKRYKNVYANIPVVFGDSPPVDRDQIDLNSFTQLQFEEALQDFDFTAKYAENSIYILDEAWQKFSEYNKQFLMDLFAFPRKRNQVFLLASAIQLGGIQHYCRLFVTKDFNYQVFGLPLLRMQSFTPGDKKPLKWFIALPSAHFGLYSTKYQPFSEKPILQFRDYGILYENDTMRAIPRNYSQFFVVNHLGLAEQRKDLTEKEQDIVGNIIPSFELDESRFADKLPKPPKAKKKFHLGLSSIFGTEFNFGFMFKFALIIWFMLAVTKYIYVYSPDHPSLFSSFDTVWTFVTLGDFSEIDVKASNDVYWPTKRRLPTLTATPTITPTATETLTPEPTITPEVIPTATQYLPPKRSF